MGNKVAMKREDPDYTFAQAVAMVNLIGGRQHEHELACEDCLIAWLNHDEPDFVAEEEFCEVGLSLFLTCNKWMKKCKYAARREGKHITI